LQTVFSQFISSRQETIVLEMVKPLAGESLLHVGCGAGELARLFQLKKCLVTGLDASPDLLAKARMNLGVQCELVEGDIENLPFSDNEYDVTVIIFRPGIMGDPYKAIAEAVRVSRKRVFIGFYNRHSFVGTEQAIREFLGVPADSAMRFFGIGEMKFMVNQIMGNSHLTWGSVLCLPVPFCRIFSEVEELFPMKNNPLGAFAGIVFPVYYTYRTLQKPLISKLDLKAGASVTVPETVRNMLRKGNG
jgi:SAM-dependent methyltransferase